MTISSTVMVFEVCLANLYEYDVLLWDLWCQSESPTKQIQRLKCRPHQQWRCPETPPCCCTVVSDSSAPNAATCSKRPKLPPNLLANVNRVCCSNSWEEPQLEARPLRSSKPHTQTNGYMLPATMLLTLSKSAYSPTPVAAATAAAGCGVPLTHTTGSQPYCLPQRYIS